MSKKDEAIIEIERLLKELKKGEEESAATAVVEHSGENVDKLVFKFPGVKNLIIALLFMVIISVGAWLFFGSTSKNESTISVEQVKEIATLATAEALVTVTIEEEDNKLFGNNIPFKIKLPGTKREILLVVPATVIAGVDLKGITSEDIKINDDKKELEIVLPRATLIQEPAILMDRVKILSNEGLFRGEVQLDEGFDLLKESQEDIKDEVIKLGLLETVEKSAAKFLKGFFENLGYTVKVTFE